MGAARDDGGRSGARRNGGTAASARPAPLPPAPAGWFAVAFGDELPPGGVVVRRLAGHELVLFRTRGGAVAAVDPYCPHLGAHLGHGGTVDGEHLRCPFHGFCFDVDGACVATGYGTRPPGKARLDVWPTIERHGIVLAFHDPAGAPPSWAVPELDTTGWSRFRRRTYELRGHPQETTENSVDLGHLAVVHGYRDVEVVTPVTVDGAHLHAGYRMRRPLGLPGLTGATETRFDIDVHGLGYSLVEASLPRLGVRFRVLVLATPTDPDRLALRVAVSVCRRPASSPLPPSLGTSMTPLVRRIVLEVVTHDVRQDIPIWEHKVHLGRPVLAEGDGPLGVYRRWARQFYPTAGQDGSYQEPPSSSAAAWAGPHEPGS